MKLLNTSEQSEKVESVRQVLKLVQGALKEHGIKSVVRRMNEYYVGLHIQGSIKATFRIYPNEDMILLKILLLKLGKG